MGPQSSDRLRRGSAFTPASPRSTEYGVHSQLFGIWPYAVVALASFVLGVAVGTVVRQSDRRTPIVLALVAPGVVAGFGFLVWTVYTLV